MNERYDDFTEDQAKILESIWRNPFECNEYDALQLIG